MIDVVFPDSEDCPDCGGFVFRRGPRGGLAQNIECIGCGSRFNITRFDPSHTDGRKQPMPIVWAQRIPSEDQGGGAWREDMFPKVLQ